MKMKALKKTMRLLLFFEIVAAPLCAMEGGAAAMDDDGSAVGAATVGGSDAVLAAVHTCAICLGDVNPFDTDPDIGSIQIRCGHYFHRQHLLRWMQTGLNGLKCPNCRFPINFIDSRLGLSRSEKKAIKRARVLVAVRAERDAFRAAVALAQAMDDDVNAADEDGNARLHRAVLDGHVMEVRRLIERNADVNVRNHDGMTPLLLAALNGHDALVLRLLIEGADVNAKNNKGDTAMHCAAQNGHVNVAEVLLFAGALVHGKNRVGLTALHIAERQAQEDRLLGVSHAQRDCAGVAKVMREWIAQSPRRYRVAAE